MFVKLIILLVFSSSNRVWKQNLVELQKTFNIAIALPLTSDAIFLFYSLILVLIIYFIIRTSNARLEQKIFNLIDTQQSVKSNLQYPTKLEEFISYLSHSFINITVTELDSTIYEGLERINKFFEIKNSCLMLLSNNHEEIVITEKWFVPQVADLSDWGKKVESKLPFMIEQIEDRDIIIGVSNIKSLTPKANSDTSPIYYIQSITLVPIIYRNNLKGVLALETSRSEKSWTDKEIQLLTFAAELMGSGIERCHQARELNNRTRQLEVSNTELEKFAYIISHDLSEPLRSISGFSYLLKEEYQSQLDLEAKEYIEFINDGAVRMKRLIDDLLAFSRINRQNLSLTTIESEDIIQEVMYNLQASIQENSVKIDYEPLPTIVADRTQIVQLWQNLIGNAIKFRNQHTTPQIYISSIQENNQTIFLIRDNGIGIDSQYAEEIFAVFKRLHTPQQYPGTGIGLAICRRIAELHNGKIWVKSSLGNGSTFYVSLPVYSGETSGSN